MKEKTQTVILDSNIMSVLSMNVTGSGKSLSYLTVRVDRADNVTDKGRFVVTRNFESIRSVYENVNTTRFERYSTQTLSKTKP